MTTSTVNKEIDQDRVFDTVDHFNKWGDPLAKQDRQIYKHLANRVEGKSVIEAGCGSGVGSNILARFTGEFLATDKTPRNIDFAAKLYPDLAFGVWDINQPYQSDWMRAQVVVAVEVFEHVEDPQAAMDNLLAAATEEVWLSTPNGIGKPRPPENPYHVCEYTPTEILYFARAAYQTDIYHWETFERIDDICTDVHPLVYHIRKAK